MADTIRVVTFDNTNAAYNKRKAGSKVKRDDFGNLSLLKSKNRLLFSFFFPEKKGGH